MKTARKYFRVSRHRSGWLTVSEMMLAQRLMGPAVMIALGLASMLIGIFHDRLMFA